jgi:hypothetical protein
MNESPGQTPFITSLKPPTQVGDIINQVGESHAIKRKPGRPAKNPFATSGKSSTDTSASAPSATQGVQQPSPPIDKELIRKSVESLLRAFDSIIVRRVYQTAMLVSKDDKQFSTTLAGNAAITKDELDLIPSLSAEVAAKYQILGQYAAEILLGVCIVGYGTRTVITFNKLREMAELHKLAKERVAQPLETNDTKSQTN